MNYDKSLVIDAQLIAEKMEQFIFNKLKNCNNENLIIMDNHQSLDLNRQSTGILEHIYI